MDESATLCRQHLEYVLLELFKNAARATMERREAMEKEMAGRAGVGSPPPPHPLPTPLRGVLKWSKNPAVVCAP